MKFKRKEFILLYQIYYLIKVPTGTTVVTLKVNYLLTGSQTEGENSAKRHCVILWWCQSRTIINIQNIANWKWTWCYLQVWISNLGWNSLKPIWLKISKITMHWICTGFKCMATRSCKYCYLALKIALNSQIQSYWNKAHIYMDSEQCSK